MGVKSIFKILIGTIAGMVLSMLLVELFNVSIASYQLRQICRMAARQSCILFTSESYKGSASDGGSVGIQDIYDCNGNLYASGNFYGVSTGGSDYVERVWNKIYTSSDFIDFCDDAANPSHPLSKYYTLPILKIAANDIIPNISINWNSSNAELEAASMAETARMYKNNLYTTNNIGIPYLNKEIVDKMYQWNLTQLLSNCDSDSIQPDGIWTESSHGMDYDPTAQMCVNFMGFRVYANQCELTNFDYKVYDISDDPATAGDKYDQEEELWKTLNIDASGRHSIGISDKHRSRVAPVTETVGGRAIYDNQYITAVGIEYNLIATYEGITPLRNIIAYVFNNQVAGYSRDGDGVNTPPDLSATPEANILNGPAYQDSINIGGFNEPNAGIPAGTTISSGKLIYTLDR